MHNIKVSSTLHRVTLDKHHSDYFNCATLEKITTTNTYFDIKEEDVIAVIDEISKCAQTQQPGAMVYELLC